MVSPAWSSLPPSFRKSRTAIVTYCSRSATALSGNGSRAEEIASPFVLGVLRQAVLAEVPDDHLVVAEHAEVVRDALRIDVPDVRCDAVGEERIDVLVEVLGRPPGGSASGLTPV